MLKLKIADYSRGSLSIFVIDGQDVRDNLYLDFTEGGNWLRYDFIPENEIWVGAISIREAPFVVAHEVAELIYAIENNLDLRQDDAYSLAHTEANEIERTLRTAPNTVDDVLPGLLEQLASLIQPEVEIGTEAIWPKT